MTSPQKSTSFACREVVASAGLWEREAEALGRQTPPSARLLSPSETSLSTQAQGSPRAPKPDATPPSGGKSGLLLVGMRGVFVFDIKIDVERYDCILSLSLRLYLAPRDTRDASKFDFEAHGSFSEILKAHLWFAIGFLVAGHDPIEFVRKANIICQLRHQRSFLCCKRIYVEQRSWNSNDLGGLFAFANFLYKTHYVAHQIGVKNRCSCLSERECFGFSFLSSFMNGDFCGFVNSENGNSQYNNCKKANYQGLEFFNCRGDIRCWALENGQNYRERDESYSAQCKDQYLVQIIGSILGHCISGGWNAS